VVADKPSVLNKWGYTYIVEHGKLQVYHASKTEMAPKGAFFMDYQKIRQWADVFYSKDCDFRLAVTLGFSGEDLTKSQFTELLLYLTEHEPNAAGLNQLFSTEVFNNE